MNVSRSPVSLEQLLETRLVERHAPGLQRLDALRKDVADDDLVTELGQAGARDEADPAGAEDPDCRHFVARQPGAYRPIGRRPLAIASIVSFESESSSVFTTQ